MRVCVCVRVCVCMCVCVGVVPCPWCRAQSLPPDPRRAGTGSFPYPGPGGMPPLRYWPGCSARVCVCVGPACACVCAQEHACAVPAHAHHTSHLLLSVSNREIDQFLHAISAATATATAIATATAGQLTHEAPEEQAEHDLQVCVHAVADLYLFGGTPLSATPNKPKNKHILNQSCYTFACSTVLVARARSWAMTQDQPSGRPSALRRCRRTGPRPLPYPLWPRATRSLRGRRRATIAWFVTNTRERPHSKSQGLSRTCAVTLWEMARARAWACACVQRWVSVLSVGFEQVATSRPPARERCLVSRGGWCAGVCRGRRPCLCRCVTRDPRTAAREGLRA